jgi:hypothetical protein
VDLAALSADAMLNNLRLRFEDDLYYVWLSFVVLHDRQVSSVYVSEFIGLCHFVCLSIHLLPFLRWF